MPLPAIRAAGPTQPHACLFLPRPRPAGAPQQQQQPGFGAGAPAFAFGGQPAAAPGGMVPNNPFGGGFSMGSSGGGSQSESGRRKVKVKRPGRK